MSDLSKYTGRFRISGGPQASTGRKVTKRPRESLTCGQCRISKLRCDKASPCGSCVKRDGGASCSYQRQTTTEEGGSSSRGIAEDRLDRLERMVTQLMQNQSLPANFTQQPTTPPDVPVDRAFDAHVAPKSDINDTKYPTLLEDIMNNINELKMALPAIGEEMEAVPPAEYNLRGSERIFGSPSAYSIEQILARYLPPRVEADRLLARYFSGDMFIMPYFHAQQFQQEYNDFWNNNNSVTPIWMSMLFSAFTMSAMAQEALHMSTRPNDTAILSPGLHIAAGECLVLGEYHRAQRYGPEAIVFYAHCVTLKTLDPSREAGAMISMGVRMAYEMGYHRDPDVFGTFSVFEGEMRRRFWAGCKQVDVMVAFQLGLPSNIRLENCDTRSPRSLLNSDFGPESQELPPSRPENEPTGLLWFIVKDRLFPSFHKVCQHALSLLPKPEDEVRALDEEIQLAQSSVPAILRVQPISECLADSRFLVMTRFYIEFLSLKSFCVLHRKHMTRGSLYSTKRCIEAGMTIVRMVIGVFKEFTPGGQLHEVRWMFNSYYFSDFLLGVIVLCLYVNICRQNGVRDDLPAIGPGSEIFALLEQARAICVDKSPASRDARKVSLAIQLALRSMDKSAVQQYSIPSEQTAALDTPLDQLPTGGSPRQDDSSWYTPMSTFEQPLSFGSLDPFSFMSTEPFDFDTTFASAGPSTWNEGMFSPRQ